MIIRLREAPGPEQLAAMYTAPHRHATWPDHQVRVAETISAGVKLLPRLDPPVIADLSAGDTAIPRALAAAAGPGVALLLGDIAPGLTVTGPIEDTAAQLADASVGLFVCCETAEHLDDPFAVLKTIRAKAARLLLSTPLSEFGSQNPEHLWAWDIDGVRDMLAGAGWRQVLDPGDFLDPLIVSYDYGDHRGAWRYQVWCCQ